MPFFARGRATIASGFPRGQAKLTAAGGNIQYGLIDDPEAGAFKQTIQGFLAVEVDMLVPVAFQGGDIFTAGALEHEALIRNLYV